MKLINFKCLKFVSNLCDTFKQILKLDNKKVCENIFTCLKMFQTFEFQISFKL